MRLALTARCTLVLLLSALIAGCSSIPVRPVGDAREDSAVERDQSSAADAEQRVPEQTAQEIAQQVERLLDVQMLVPQGASGPLLVDTGSARLGIAQREQELLVWRLTEDNFSTVPIDGDIEILSFTALSLKYPDGRPDGFRARIHNGEADEDIFVLDNGNEYAYVVRAAASSSSRSELRDVDGDGEAEMVRYSLVFEAPGHRELIVDLLEWENGSFIHRASVPLVRRLNQRLAEFEWALVESSDPNSINRLAAALTPIEGAPDPRTMLPATEAMVPPINELAVELDESSWRFSHEIALMPGPAIYRIEIELIADPTRRQPARILGVDD